ncbi:MAG: hypothetical protein Kow00109_04490 [Acidobacteriota bacterium]
MRRCRVLAMVTVMLAAMAMVAAGVAGPVELRVPAKVGGVTLSPGKYWVEVNEQNEAQIRQGKEVIVRFKVTIEPLDGVYPNSVVVDKEGRLAEIRLAKEKLILQGVGG